MVDKKRLFVLGDSISMHYGPYLEEYIKPRFTYQRKTTLKKVKEDLDQPALHNANGGDSGMVLAYLRHILGTNRPVFDILLLNCGLHDIKTNPVSGKKQVALPQYKRNLQAALTLLKKYKKKAIWVRTTPVCDKQHNKPGMIFHRFHRDELKYNRAADAVMAGAKIPSIDLNTFTKSLGPALFADHIHFPEHIQKLQAAYIAGCLVTLVPNVSLGTGAI